MNYSSPSRLEAGVSPRESLPPHIWIPEPFFFLVPVLAPGLLALICNATSVSLLFISPSFFFLSVIWCLLTGLTQGSQVSPGPRCFALLCGEEQVAAGQQVIAASRRGAAWEDARNCFRAVKDATFTKMKTYTQKLLSQ